MRTARYFSIIQLSNSRAFCQNPWTGERIWRKPFFRNVKLTERENLFIIFLSLTVVGRKNRCIPCIYWATAIFAVVSDYSNLFLPLAFFLDRSHLTLSHELIVCPKTTGLMKIICDRLPFI